MTHSATLGPAHLLSAVHRPMKPRTAALVAKDAWQYCVDFFDKLPLVLEPGAIDDPESDYGGLRTLGCWAKFCEK